MNLHEIKNHIIQGYTLLTAKQRSDFEQNEVGQEFIRIATEHYTNQGTAVENIVTSLLLGQSPNDELPGILAKEGEEFKQKFGSKIEYQTVIEQIRFAPVEKLAERTHKLANFFPLLAPHTQALIEYYKSQISNKSINAEQIEFNTVYQLIFNELQSVSNRFELYLDPHEVTEFNKNKAKLAALNSKYATTIARNIIAKFNVSESSNTNQLLHNYNEELADEILDCILTIKSIKPLPKEQRKINTLTATCLNWLWNNSKLSDASEYFDQFGDSFIFLTQTGFISQKDGFLINLLELKKANKIQNEINESRSIFAKIVSPLKPLWDEFKEISQHEKNKLHIFVRSLIPVLIALGFIIGATVLLNPLLIPEVIVAVVIIPVLIYVGLGLAAAYCSVKNGVFNYFKHRLYGGPYEIPEFQINQRLREAFGTEKKAKSVRSFYVDELIKCDTIENNYKEKEEASNNLSTLEITLRKENLERRFKLGIEWHRLSCDGKLGSNEIKPMFLQRLRSDEAEELKRMEAYWKQHDEPNVKIAVDELKPRFALQPRANNTQVNNTQPNNNYGRFFQPISLGPKPRAEQIETFARSL